MMEFKLCFAQVVEMSYARRVLYAIGCGGYRVAEKGADDLIIHRRLGADDYAFYRTDERRTKDSFLGKIAVDEGIYSTFVDTNGELRRGVTDPADELVDYTSLLRIICKALFPDWIPTGSPYIGLKASARHYCEQFEKRLNGCRIDNRIEFSVEGT